MVPPRTSHKRKATSTSEGGGGKKLHLQSTEQRLEDHAILNQHPRKKTNVGSTKRLSPEESPREITHYVKHKPIITKTGAVKNMHKSDATQLREPKAAVMKQSSKSKKLNTPGSDVDKESIDTEQPAKNVYLDKSPFIISNNEVSAESKESNSGKRKFQSPTAEVPNKKYPITHVNLSKKNNVSLATNPSTSEDEYASHFSTDSDSSVDERMHLDRTIQRERRRAQSERLQRTIFVGNLPSLISRKHLKQIFNKALRADPKCAAKNCHVESVRFRGVVPSTGGTGKLARKRAVVQGETSAGISETLLAYVVLSSKVGVPVALKLNGHWVAVDPPVKQPSTEGSNVDAYPSSALGRFIRVDATTSGMSTIKPQTCVFLGNLAFNVQEDEIRDAFAGFGPISNVRLIRDRQTGAVKGIGYVQFEDETAVSLAIRASQSISIRNRPVRVQECKPTGDNSVFRKKHTSWKPKQPSDKVTTPKAGEEYAKKSSTDTFSSTSKKPRIHLKLNQTGKAKGITLPSNLHGSLRRRYLAKRLIKKRKRQIHRQKLRKQQTSGIDLYEKTKKPPKTHNQKQKVKHVK